MTMVAMVGPRRQRLCVHDERPELADRDLAGPGADAALAGGCPGVFPICAGKVVIGYFTETGRDYFWPSAEPNKEGNPAPPCERLPGHDIHLIEPVVSPSTRPARVGHQP